MAEEFKGSFQLRLQGLPFLMASKLHLRSERGFLVEGWALHLGPFVIGFVLPKGKKEV